MSGRGLSAAVAAIAADRTTQHDNIEQWRKAGWIKLDPKFESLELHDNLKNLEPFALVNCRGNVSPGKIFQEFLPPDFVSDVFARNIKVWNGSMVTVSSTKNTVCMRKGLMNEIYQFLAARAYIHGKQYNSSFGVRKAFTAAKNFFAEKYPNKKQKLAGASKLYRINTVFFLYTPEDEDILCKNFTNYLSNLGQVLCGDEKLFYFTGHSELVRKVPSKPDSIGHWHYEATVLLDEKTPFVVYTRLHRSSKAANIQVKASKIVQEWSEMTKKNHSQAIIIMDSYYLTKEAREALNNSGTNFLAQIPKSREEELWNMADYYVKSAGQYGHFYNIFTHESLACYYAQLPKEQKKLVLSNGFSLRKTRTQKNSIRLYDDYKYGYNGCDLFNKSLHGKTWPFRHGGKGRNGSEACVFDFLFSVLLINTYNIVRMKRGVSVVEYKFEDFTTELALEIVREYI